MRFVAAFFLFLSLIEAAVTPEYRFSVIRHEKTAQLAKGYEPFLSYLSERTGFIFRFTYTDTHQDLIEQMAQGHIAVGYMGSQPYVALKARCPDAEPAAIFLDEAGHSNYRCSLAVKTESPIAAVSQVSDQRLALTQRFSTCGWLSPQNVLQKAGSKIEANRFRFAGTHVDAVMALMLGEADVAAARSDIVDRYRHMGIRHLHQNGPYPNFVIVFNTRQIPKAHRKAIKKALLELKAEDAAGRTAWHPYLRYGTAAADDSLFDAVRLEMQAIGELP